MTGLQVHHQIIHILEYDRFTGTPSDHTHIGI